ncbi:hypothetical protein BGZ68_002656 [Mortierella alpina]|nr:hypothetical protein BGZ68_002656 [Mortierella alpina]
MSNSPLSLFCLVDEDSPSSAFQVLASTTTTVPELKKLIKAEVSPRFDNVAANDLKLWRVNDPFITANLHQPVLLKTLGSATELYPMDRVVDVFPAAPPKRTIHLIVQRPSPDPQFLPQKKKVRIVEAWQSFTAADRSSVELPPSWIDILSGLEFVPEPRAAFAHLKDYLQPGDAITVPGMGQVPKEFGSLGQGQTLFVTEQMLELWEDMRVDQERTYRRVLSGPTGVGKSYLSYFLVARAYAERWLVLYISDAALLNERTEEGAALQMVQRFLTLNKDILTGAELQMLVSNYDGTLGIWTCALSTIFDEFLKSRDRNTLLLVDEHRLLFEEEPFIPDKFTSLVPLSSFSMWDELNAGTRVIFAGTAHAKYEMTILHDSYRLRSVVFVGPLSVNVFSKLLDTYPTFASPIIREGVIAIPNCVPRELVLLSAFLEQLPGPISQENLQKWTANRSKYFFSIAARYYDSRTPFRKPRFYEALIQTFLGSTGSAAFDWDFMDLGLIYRSEDLIQGGTQLHILCRPARMALLELFKRLPLPEITRRRLCDDSSLGRDQFETALCHQLICATKPILLNATDLNGRNPCTVTLNFSHCVTLRTDQISLGLGHDKVLTRGYEGYPRFDFMVGAMFIQASISDFGSHNDKGSANLSKAFDDRDSNGSNQIERYLNDLFGPGHSARIENNRFVVTKNGVPVPGFHVVYIRGSPGKPTHRALVNMFPDVLHVSFEELRENLFKNIV